MPFHDQLVAATGAAREALYSVPAIRECLAGHVTRTRYAAFLREAFHHVRHTVPLLRACGARLPETRGELRAAVAHYIEEEQGHDQWILQDIAACGEDAVAAKTSRPSPATQALVDYAYDYVRHRNPVGLFGMVHVLEGTSSALATRAAQVIERSLGLPATALTYLTSHGELDRAHVKFFENLANALPASDQAAVTEVAQNVYRLYAGLFRELPA